MGKFIAQHFLQYKTNNNFLLETRKLSTLI